MHQFVHVAFFELVRPCKQAPLPHWKCCTCTGNLIHEAKSFAHVIWEPRLELKQQLNMSATLNDHKFPFWLLSKEQHW